MRQAYNVNVLTQAAALFVLERLEVLEEQAARIRAERARLGAALAALPGVDGCFRREANFFLVRVRRRRREPIEALKRQGVLVRNLHPALDNCLRITVGTPDENRILLNGAARKRCDDRMNVRHRRSHPQHQGNADPGEGEPGRHAARRRLATGLPFLEHMLDQVARHGMLDLEIEAKGDLHIDAHHTVEDIGITLGQAVAKAIGDKAGVRRFGHAYVPLDEALSRVVIDFSGRPGLEYHVKFTRALIGEFDVDLVHEFFQGFVNHAQVTLHIDNLRGDNAHHQCETMFKAFARALRMAASRPARGRRGALDQGLAVSALMRIAVVDYGMGNLRSVSKAMEHVAPQAQVRVTADPEEIPAADRVVVPGQGAMPDCMRQLAASGARDAVVEAARAKPFLGICIGLQMLFEHGEEGDTARAGRCSAARCPRFAADGGSRSRTWAGTRCCRAGRTRCGPGIPRLEPLLLRAQLLSRARAMRRLPPRTACTARPLPAPWPGIIFLPSSSILKKASPPACNSSPISCAGVPDFLSERSSPTLFAATAPALCSSSPQST